MNMLQPTPEQEPQLPIEREQKFLPVGIDLSPWLPEAQRIEQIYLSHPAEDWGMRVRKTSKAGQETSYEATLKSRSGTHSRTLVRHELNTPISEAAYNFYAEQNLPRVQKLRATLGSGVTMDWLTDEHDTIQPFVLEIEGEGPDQTQFYDAWKEKLVNVSGFAEYDNEQVAHALWSEPEKMSEFDIDNLSTARIVQDIKTIAERSERPIVVGIKGRSGSGKSTLTNSVASYLEMGADMAVIKLSTDDYHRGKKWLLTQFGVSSWDNWDAPIVYNTAALAFDLREYLEKAEPIRKRHFDFFSEEPVIESEAHPPARIILIEGLFPHAPELSSLLDHTIELQTPPATCIGRRIVRDMKNRLNDSFGNAEAILRYQVETAEPAYQKHK